MGGGRRAPERGARTGSSPAGFADGPPARIRHGIFLPRALLACAGDK